MGHKIPHLGWRRQLGGLTLGGGGAQITHLEDGFAGLTLVNTDGTITAGATLAFTAQTTPTWSDLGAYGGAQTRAAGLCFAANLTLTTWEECGVAWHSAAAIVDPDSTNNTIQANTTDGQFDNVTPISVVTGLSTSTEYPLIIEARNLGARLWIQIGGAWRLLWVDNTGADTTIYPIFANLDAAGSISVWRVALLPTNATYPVPALGVRDLDLCTPGTGTGTSSIASPAAGNTFVHTADTLIEFDLTTVPSSGDITIFFRKLDANNYWYLRIRASGDYDLVEVVGGGGTIRGTVSGVVSGGEKIILKVNNETITGYYNGTLAWTYASATNFKTATAGQIIQLGTGGAIANFTAKTLDGVANAASSNHPGYGLATDVLPGPRAAADTFTHEADAIIEFQLEAISTAADIIIPFRYQDATNFWWLRLRPTGNYDLVETAGGVAITRGSAAGVLSGGERIVIVANGTTIKGYYNTTLAWTYSSAINFQTETSGKVNSLGTGGRASNFITWPPNLASAPNTPEAANVKAAFDLMAAS